MGKETRAMLSGALLVLAVLFSMGVVETFNFGQRHNVCGPGLSGYELDAHLSDTELLPRPVRRFRVGGSAGDVKVRYVDNTVHTIPDVQQFELIDAHVIQIFDTGTDADGLSGWE